MKPRAGDFERDGESGLLLPRGRQRGGPRVHPQYLGPAFFASAAGGGGGGSASANAFRLSGITTPGSSDFELSELEFWNNGATQMATFGASLAPFFGTTVDLFDGSLGTRPIWNASDVNTAGFYIHVHFPTPRAIDSIKMAGYDTSGRYPTQVSLSYNDTANFATKTLQASASGLTYPGNALSAAIDLDGGGTPGAHTDWYLHAMSVSGFLEIAEVQFLAGGVVQGNVFTFSHAPASGGVAQLIDGLLSSRIAWSATTAEGSGFYIQWNPGAVVEVDAIKLGAFDNSGDYTSTATLQYFDGSTWQTLGTASGLVYPGNNTLSGQITF